MEAKSLKEIIKEEYKKCLIDPVHFMKRFCQIQHPQKGKIPFHLYPFQEEALIDLRDHDYNVILKSRQLGISTLSAGYALWIMTFFGDKNILVIATKQEVAKNLVLKVKVMYENLPSWLKLTATEDNKLSLRFINGSQIKATSSSGDSGRSEALSLLIIDEAQDLTPLQWKFVYKLAAAAEKIYIAGDDDQAIYEWNGALVRIFQEFPGRKVVLKYSHRLNKQIHTFAKLIRSKIKNTEEKEFNCGLGEGNVMLFKKFQEIPFHLFEGKWYILARIRECVKELTEEAQKMGLYYENVKGKKSFDIYQYKALKIWTDLIGGATINKEQAALCYEYIQEISRGYRKLDSRAWLEIDPSYQMDFETLQVVGGLETTKKKEPWYDAFNRRFSDTQKRYFFKMETLNIDLNTKANIIIDTIHQVKGGEAENVVLYAKTNWPSDFDGKNLDAKSNEARVWYTGSTRSKKNLFLLGTTHKYSFPLAQIYNTYMENINVK